jgi:hypothetical protein
MNETAEALTAPRRKWTQVSWKRVVLILALIFAGMGSLEAIVWYFEPWYFAHEMSRDHAGLSVTPETLRDSSSSKLSPARLQCFEYSFQVPWQEIEQRKDSRSAAIIRFKRGPTMIAFDPAQMTSLSKDLRKNAKQLERVFGQRALSSGYDWMGAELSATPDSIRWWDREANVRTAVLLGLKSSQVLQTSTAILRISNAKLKGFQLGDPTKDQQVKLELFDVNDRQYELLIASTAKSEMTQADINAIVASMRPIPHS